MLATARPSCSFRRTKHARVDGLSNLFNGYTEHVGIDNRISAYICRIDIVICFELQNFTGFFPDCCTPSWNSLQVNLLLQETIYSYNYRTGNRITSTTSILRSKLIRGFCFSLERLKRTIKSRPIFIIIQQVQYRCQL